jgi:futalosine hydrolase
MREDGSMPPRRSSEPPRLLVVTAVPAEAEAVSRGVGSADEVTILAGGVGAPAAAAATAAELALAAARREPYQWVVSAGIGGGFADRASIGATVLATSAVAADLGAETADGFVSVAELGFGQSIVDCDGGLLAALRRSLPSAVVGPVLTVSTVTGTAERAAALRERYPDAVAEAMEGYGVGTAAVQAGVGFVEVRTVSNPVGPRDRERWRIADALVALEQSGAALANLML